MRGLYVLTDGPEWSASLCQYDRYCLQYINNLLLSTGIEPVLRAAARRRRVIEVYSCSCGREVDKVGS